MEDEKTEKVQHKPKVRQFQVLINMDASVQPPFAS
jgi:hypothetical protein